MEPHLVSVALTLLLPILLLWPLERLFPAYRQPLWRSDTHLDVLYLLCMPAIRGALLGLVLLIALACGLSTAGWLRDGFGPLGAQPVWVQVILFLVLFDLSSYWVHRWFHGVALWKFHAIHHSSRQLDWLSTVRHHPINDVSLRIGQSLPVLLFGLSPQVVAWCLPLMTLHSLLIHANLSWTFGPLGWLVVSPAYHHWHHTTRAEGRDKNFAELCPLWDVLFGTYFHPADRHPTPFGIDDVHFPSDFLGQILYPFRRTKNDER